MSRAVLWIGVGAGDGGDDDWAILRSIAQSNSQMPRRVDVTAEAQHAIEQDHSDGRIGEGCGQRFVAYRRLDHRMRPAAGVFVGTEIEHGVLLR